MRLSRLHKATMPTVPIKPVQPKQWIMNNGATIQFFETSETFEGAAPKLDADGNIIYGGE